ncbi:MAG TPA: site-specific integrase [Cyclobacteriaceae bacterium]|nr:site-specific integrase [Cyclobacteriaceae bacterium]
MQTTFSTKFVVHTSKLKDGLVPVFCRITVGGRRAEFSIKRKVLLASWGNGVMKGNSEEARTLNSYMKVLDAKVFDSYRELIAQGRPITADGLKNAFLGVKEGEQTLLGLIDYHNSQLKGTIEWGTMKNYFTTQKYIRDFLKTKLKLSDIPLVQLSYKFVVDFETYLRSYKPVDYHHPMGNNTVMKHIERLRKVTTVAVKNEWLERDPFMKFKAKFIRNDREYLNEQQLAAIETKVFGFERLEWVRDLFVFSCYTGLSYSDVMRLTPHNISIGIDGEHWIMTTRKKTNQPVRVPLLPKALEIIRRYKDAPKAANEGTLFPNLSNQKLNSYLKEIADFCGIGKKLTFHVARHTFATTVTLTNGVPIETVSKMLGHASIRTTQIYSKVVEKKVSEDMKVLRQLLKARDNKEAKDSNSISLQ